MRSGRRQWRMSVLIVLNVILTVLLALPASAFGAATGVPTVHALADKPVGPVRLVGADSQGVRLELTTPVFDLTAPAAVALAGAVGTACQQAQAEGFVQSAEVGRPQLPVKVVLLGVPPDAELALDVISSPARTIAGGITLCAARAPQPEAAGDQPQTYAEAVPALDPAVYGVDAFYPAETVRLIDLGFMRSQRIVRLEFYPVQFNPVTRELRVNDHVNMTLRYDQRPNGAQTAASAGPVTEPDEFETAYRNSLLNYDAARAFRRISASPTMAAAAAPTAAWTPPSPGYKVSVREEGIYQLTYSELAAAGLPVDQLDPRTLQMFEAGKKVAIRVLGEEDGKFDTNDVVLFFGQGANTRYTDTNVYWLSYGGEAGLRMSSRSNLAGGVTAASFLTTVKKEDNLLYDSDLPMLSGYDHWYGQTITAAGAGGKASVSISVATPGMATGGQNASVSVKLGAIQAGSHHVRLYVNPASHPDSAWDGSWDGIDTVHLISAAFPQSYLSGTGDNTVKIEIINDYAGRAADIVRLDWLEVGYKHQYMAASDQLMFGGDTPGARRYSVGGFSTQDVDLYDVTDAAHVARITGATVELATFSTFLPLVLRSGPSAASAVAAASAGGAAAPAAYALRFGDNQTTSRRYLAQSPQKRLNPISIALDQPSNLQAASPGADYIIITHADFTAAIQPLADFRATQELRVRVVDVQDIYDEFGGGLMSAEAIRDFVAYAYNNWTRPAPASVLLVGDGTYDFRHYKNATPTFIPPYLEMVDPDAGETAADNRFVAVTPGDNLPDLDIGRLPANSPAEATAMVNKILSYEAQATADWMKQVLFVTDDLEGGGGDFYAYSDGIADGHATYKGSDVKILPASYTPNKIYLGNTCDLSNPAISVECRTQIIGKLNAGSLMVSYIGHGVKTYWAAERLYDMTALESVSNADRLPIMLPMTCNEGYFVDPTESSLSELEVRATGKGAIASWAPTGLGLAPGHDFLERGLFLAVFHDGKSLGSGATAAKLYLVANAPPGKYLDLIDTFLLLGDPALRVP
jgi:hypothetical protein